jgi:hypothetical protein
MSAGLVNRLGFVRPLRAGEHDLANVYLLGHEPLTGRDYTACRAEFDAAYRAVTRQNAAVPSWNIPARIRRWWNIRALDRREGIPVSFLGAYPGEVRPHMQSL